MTNRRYVYPLHLFYEGRSSSTDPMTCRICHEVIERKRLRIHIVKSHHSLLDIYVHDGKARLVDYGGTDGTWANIILGRLRAERGNKCIDCGRTSINGEFHHIKPTGLSGMGRGSSQRAKDIRDNPDSYVLLCRSCHRTRHKNALIAKVRSIHQMRDVGNRYQEDFEIIGKRKATREEIGGL